MRLLWKFVIAALLKKIIKMITRKKRK